MLENIVQTDKLLPLGLIENMQLKELYQYGKQNLRNYSVETPGLEAYMLLSKSELLKDLSEVYSYPEKEIDEEGVEKFRGLLKRRINGEPTAYIMGKREFYSRSFKVNPSVLIPRPETELLVDETVDIINQAPNALVLEIGTGSGCVAITIASLCENARIVASDISKEALLVAKENSTDHRQNERISFVEGDLLNSFKNNAFDMVVSNPPYIKEQELPDLEPEVRDYEPKISLAAGKDGLYYIKKIISESTSVLKDGGSCVLEIGHGQRESVENIFKELGYIDISYRNDLNGIERVVRAIWKK